MIWPYQLPWYDAMAICLLVLYPASALDWLVVTRLAVATLANMPGNPGKAPGHLLQVTDKFIVHTLAPVVLLTCAALLVLFALTRQWGVTGGADLGRFAAVRRSYPATMSRRCALGCAGGEVAPPGPPPKVPGPGGVRVSPGATTGRGQGCTRLGGVSARARMPARGMIMTLPRVASWSPQRGWLACSLSGLPYKANGGNVPQTSTAPEGKDGEKWRTSLHRS